MSKLIQMLEVHADRPRQMTLEDAVAYLCHLLITRGEGFYGSAILSSPPDGWKLSDTMLSSTLSVLDDEGWVDCHEQKVEGRGRPRKIYTIAPGAETEVQEAAKYWGSS